jgi:hypothetical protein
MSSGILRRVVCQKLTNVLEMLTAFCYQGDNYSSVSRFWNLPRKIHIP